MTKSGAAATSLPELVTNQLKALSRIWLECQAPPSVEYKDVDETSFLELLCQTPVTQKSRLSTLRKLSELWKVSCVSRQQASINI